MSTNWQRSGRAPAVVAHPPAASLDEAHLAIELWEHYARKTLDDDQRLAVELMLAESEDRRWAADTTGRAESRQNGKGDEIEVVELWGLTQRGEAILHTAHEAATAASAHERMVSLIESHPDLSRKVAKKQSWNGNYSLRLNNGATIVWRTRTGAGGRGLDDISRIVVDEAQHAQPEELASSLPILSVNPNPQKNFIGSGGVSGKSGFWWRLRRRALQGQPGRFSWLEHSAEVVGLDADGRVISSIGDVRDPETWMRANPAYPSRISHDFLLDQLETLGEELFAREHLCVWDPEPTNEREQVFSADDWAACRDPEAQRGRVTYAIEVDRDGYAATIAASDGTTGLVLEWHNGSKWLPKKLAEVLADKHGTVWLHPKGPTAALLPDLEAAGIPWREITETDLSSACAQLFAAVTEDRSFRHTGQPVLDIALRQASRRPYGNSWVWDRRRPNMSVSPLVAVTIARWAALQVDANAGGGWMVSLR